jgi:WD40 repeat protein
VLLLDPKDERLLRTLRPLGTTDRRTASALAFAPDGTLATGNWGGIVQLWDPTSGAELGHPVLAAAAPLASISFDPSGRRCVTTGGGDGSARLWFTDTLQTEGTSLTPTSGSWGNAQFTPDGRHVIVIHNNGTGTIFPVTLAAWEQHACAVAGRNLTHEEWSRFVTGHSYAHVCP